MKKVIAVLFGFLILAAAAAAVIYPAYIDRQNRKNYPLAFGEQVEKYSELYGVPEEIIYAVIRTESAFNKDAVSHAGARGLMQLMPDTDEWLTLYYVKLGEGYDVFDPDTNINLGTYYLSYAYKRYGNWETAYASYNAGIGRVDSWLKDTRYSDDGVTLKYIPIKETSDYVVKVSSAALMYKELYFSDNSEKPDVSE